MNVDLNWLLNHAEYIQEATSSDFDNIFAMLGYCGARSKNLITKQEQSYESDGSKALSVYEYDYQIDAAGYPVKVVVYEVRNEIKNAVTTYAITYKSLPLQ